MSRARNFPSRAWRNWVGDAHVTADTAELAAREVCGVRPVVVVSPADAAQIAELLHFAAVEKLAVIPTSGCTKLNIGSPPAHYDLALDLSRLNRVLAYDPQDLTLGVEPGVRIEDLLRTLAEKRQFLPLAIPFADRATIGGMEACDLPSAASRLRSCPRFLSGHGVCDWGEASERKRRPRREERDGLRLAQIADRVAQYARRHYAREFPHLPRCAGAGDFRRVIFSAEAAFDFCRVVSHSVLTPATAGNCQSRCRGADLFSGEISARL
jgi:hypothetical protein